jgi:hypothetical protein
MQSESVKSISEVVEKTLPFHYERCMATVEETTRELWMLYQKTEDEHLKLKCLREIRTSVGEAYMLLRSGKGVRQMSNVRETVAEMGRVAAEWKKRALERDGRWG